MSVYAHVLAVVACNAKFHDCEAMVVCQDRQALRPHVDFEKDGCEAWVSTAVHQVLTRASGVQLVRLKC